MSKIPPVLKLVPMEVHYIDHMGHDNEICNDARISMGNDRVLNTLEVTPRDESLIHYLARENHFTPFAHQILKLRLKAPIYVNRQLRTHQVGLNMTDDNLSLVINEESRRYISSIPEFYMPEQWRRKHPKLKQGSYQDQFVEVLANPNLMIGIATPAQLVEMSTRMALEVYCGLIESDVAPEQARMVLPVNTMVNWVWTGSLAAWSRICNLRLDGHAQSETREVAAAILTIMQDRFPVATKALVKHELPLGHLAFQVPPAVNAVEE